MVSPIHIMGSQPLEKNFKDGLQVGLPIMMEDSFLSNHDDVFAAANAILAP